MAADINLKPATLFALDCAAEIDVSIIVGHRSQNIFASTFAYILFADKPMLSAYRLRARHADNTSILSFSAACYFAWWDGLYTFAAAGRYYRKRTPNVAEGIDYATLSLSNTCLFITTSSWYGRWLRISLLLSFLFRH